MLNFMRDKNGEISWSGIGGRLLAAFCIIGICYGLHQWDLEIDALKRAQAVSRDTWIVSAKDTTIEDGVSLTKIRLIGNQDKEEEFTIARPIAVELSADSPETLFAGECANFSIRYPQDRAELQNLGSYLVVNRDEVSSDLPDSLIDDE